MKSRSLGIRFALAGAALLTASFAWADYSSNILSQGPVGYWRLNETLQPQLFEYTAANSGALGSAYDGTFSNGAKKGGPSAIVSEPTHHSAYFPFAIDGNRVRVPYASAWNANSAFSVEFWAKPGVTNLGCPAASVEFSTPRNGWLFYQGPASLSDGNGWFFRIYHSSGSSVASVGFPIDTNAWYHVVGVFDGSSIKLYTNGALAASTALPSGATYTPTANTAIPLTFGARADGASGYFTYTGYVDEPAFYSKALTDVQVLSHYQAGTSASPATPYEQVVLADSPAGYWRLDEVDPVTPVAANLGSLGSAADGGYYYAASAGQPGPRPTAFPGFESGNNSVAFNGANGSVTIPALNLKTNNLTITAWIKRDGDQVANTAIVLSDTAHTVAGLKFDSSVQELSYNWNANTADSGFRSYLAIPDATWVFTALVIRPDSATLALYDGTTFSSTVNYVAHDPLPFDDVTLIGADTANITNTFKGSIDEVAVFNRALSVGELFTEYATAVGGLSPQIFTDATATPGFPYAGDTLTLSVDAGGTAALSYQWKKNALAITGATNSTYVKTGITVGDSGSYTVVIANAFGTVTSASADVTVSASTTPTISQDPQGRTLYPGGLLNLTTVAAGGNLSYQWKNGSTAIAGATNDTYTVTNVTAADAGTYTVTVKNSLGSQTSGAAVIKVITPVAGSYESVIVADAPLSWWRLNDAPGESTAYDSFGRYDGTYQPSAMLGAKGVVANSSDTAASSDGTSPIASVPYSKDLNTDVFSVEVWAKTAVAGSRLSPVSSYSLKSEGGRGYAFLKTDGDIWNGITGNADGYSYYYGGMNPLILNHWTHLVATYNSGTLKYYQDGVLVAGPYSGGYKKNVSEPFLIGGLNPGGSLESFWNGEIDEVLYYNKILTDAQIQSHYLTAVYGPGGTKPVFTAQPSSVTASEGASVSFSGTAEGTVPITYQWSRGATNIAGATNATYSISSADFADADTYYLTASNVLGTTVSSPAVLKVTPEPVFANVTNNLVLHLKFDGDLTDATGRGNNGNNVGATSFVDGKLGKALHYSTDTSASTYNYVDLGTPADLAFGVNNFSVSLWIRLPKGYLLGDLPFLANSSGSYTNPGLTLAPSYQKGGWSWGIGSVGTYGADASINDGNWHHLLYSFDRSSVAVTYLDGTQVDSRPDLGGGSVDTGTSFSIGQDTTGTYQETGSADIDDLGIWSRALTPLEVQTIYKVGANHNTSFDTYGPVSLQVRKPANALELIWQAGTLLESTSVNGPWTPVAGAAAPYYKADTTSGTKFYRVKL